MRQRSRASAPITPTPVPQHFASHHAKPNLLLPSKVLGALAVGLLVLLVLFGRAGDPEDITLSSTVSGDAEYVAESDNKAKDGATEKSSSFVIAGYVPDYRLDHVIENMKSLEGIVTDLILFSATLKGNMLDVSLIGETRLREAIVQARKHHIPRVLLTVGGAGRSAGFAQLASQPKERAKFALMTADLLEMYGLDGLDVDWEAPSNDAEVNFYIDLLASLKAVFSHRKLILSVTTHFWDQMGSRGYNLVDRVMLMAYDLGPQHARMQDTKKAVSMLVQRGLDPAGKLVLGIPAYGRRIESPHEVITYADLIRNHGVKAADVDEYAGWSYNGLRTVREKKRWANDAQFAGIFLWEVGQDSLQHPSKSLLSAMG